MQPSFVEVATIASGTALSGIINCGGGDLVGIQFPSAWTAADLTFQASADGVNFSELFDDAATPVVISVGADASLYVAISAAKRLVGLRFIKVRSGTSGTPVNQGAERKLLLVFASR
jgi:hypothetical protein